MAYYVTFIGCVNPFHGPSPNTRNLFRVLSTPSQDISPESSMVNLVYKVHKMSELFQIFI
jgi:hypothetical protein